MSEELLARIARALGEKDSLKFKTPSGSTLDLMTEFLGENKLRAVSLLFVSFSQLYPGNVGFVEGNIPGKIREFLIKYRDIDGDALHDWCVNNPRWEDAIMRALPNPDVFEEEVERIAESAREGIELCSR